MPVQPNPSAQWTEPTSSAVGIQMMEFVKGADGWAVRAQASSSSEPDGYALYASGGTFDIQESGKVYLQADGRIEVFSPGFSPVGTRLYPVLIGGVWYFTDVRPIPAQGFVLWNRIMLPSEVAFLAQMEDGQVIIY